ncbi:Tn3 family transposase, partial [Streptomyces sp. TRM75561]|nr:Tn3 family transposase [Streptomyces sp. TRM75561]
MLTAVMRQLEAKAIDEALDLFQVLMATRLLNTAKRKTEKERLSTLPQLEKASRVLARAAKVLFEELVEEQEADLDVAALWAAVEEVAPRAAVMSAAATVVTLVPEDENSAEVAMRAALANRHATVRPFLALLGESRALDAASAGKRVLAGVRGLPALARRKVGVKPLLPREVDDKLVPPAWRKAVYAHPDLPQGAVDRDAYVVCVLEQLHRALNTATCSPHRRTAGPTRA